MAAKGDVILSLITELLLLLSLHKSSIRLGTKFFIFTKILLVKLAK